MPCGEESGVDAGSRVVWRGLLFFISGNLRDKFLGMVIAAPKYLSFHVDKLTGTRGGEGRSVSILTPMRTASACRSIQTTFIPQIFPPIIY